MAAVRKAHASTQPVVEYVQSGDTYRLYTLSARAAKEIGATYSKRDGCYCANVTELPARSKISLVPHTTRPTTDVFRAKLLQRYDRLVKLTAVLEKMQREVDVEEQKLISDLKRGGLHLKPGLLDDAQAVVHLGGKTTRLHNCQSLTGFIDQEAYEALSEEFPELKKCMKKRSVPYLDRESLEEVVNKLPDSVHRAIYCFSVVESLREIPLPKPQCSHCGGKWTKLGVCKHCGIARGQ